LHDARQVNKPYLPLASGEFSMRTAAGVVAATGAAALALGAAARSPPLMATLAGSLALGVAYSTDLPGLRWKQHPLAAAACILAVRCGGRVRGRVRVACAGSSTRSRRPRASWPCGAAAESGLGSGLACGGSRIRLRRPHVSWPCGAAAKIGLGSGKACVRSRTCLQLPLARALPAWYGCC